MYYGNGTNFNFSFLREPWGSNCRWSNVRSQSCYADNILRSLVPCFAFGSHPRENDPNMDTDLIGMRIYNAQNLKHFQAKQGETLYCYSWPTLHGIKVTTTFTTLAGLDPPCIVQCTMGKCIGGGQPQKWAFQHLFYWLEKTLCCQYHS